ncbi:MAG TPA: GspH/FimT family pseudopilin [Vicinamibacterales bacterium]|nr:GspH/FimT family pseudopilin [Vicinamibacterales bacterium]
MTGRWIDGYSLIELVFVMGLVATLGAMAVPQTRAAMDDARTAGAARYVAGRLQRARTEAITRSSSVGIKFTQTGGQYAYGVYVDGNGNGVRTSDISNGIDLELQASERLSDQFPSVDFGALPGLPPVDAGGTPPGSDPVRLGSSNIASFSPQATATSGSLYIRGQHAQYVVRLYGDTARTRILKFDARARQWRPL